ncbi:MAG: acetate kinase [Bacteroidales bacterium]|nr:acetate kinase [Bacteroidales bacterium]
MRVLVLNCGSSSIKYKLYDMETRQALAQGGIEKIGLPASFLKLTAPSGEKVVIEHLFPDHTVGIEFIFDILTKGEYACISSLHDIDAVGHRVVHGGEKFNASMLITPEVIDNIVACSDLAPLHNPANLLGIEAVSKIAPQMPQVAVFDTAFHQTMPPKAYMYGLPYEYYQKYAVRRYGFHGTSHRYVSRKACEVLGLDYEHTRIVTAHIGNGGSLAAIKDGKCIDTTMGLTPLEGLLMGTRSGDIDAGAVLYLMDKEHLTTKQINDILNKKIGLMGVSGVSSDMRELVSASEAGSARATLAMDMYHYRVKKYIGAFAAAMGGLDLLVLTGGIGENQVYARAEICSGLEFLGIKVDHDANARVHGGDTAVITTADSTTKVIVLPTDEEWMIAYDTVNCVK